MCTHTQSSTDRYGWQRNYKTGISLTGILNNWLDKAPNFFNPQTEGEENGQFYLSVSPCRERMSLVSEQTEKIQTKQTLSSD